MQVGDTRRIKRYFYVLYGSGRRIYEGAKKQSFNFYGSAAYKGVEWPKMQKEEGCFFLHPNKFLPAP